ncbi:hypothetical protein Q604_UNBC02677G0001, partial [human gut metagenome]
TEGADYIVKYENNVNIGIAKVTIRGKGNYKGVVTKEFNITKVDISNVAISTPVKREYTGQAIKPYPVVGLANARLNAGRDYTVKFENNVEPGTAKIIITGTGKYKGTVERTFTIYRNLSKMEATLSATNYLYDGTAKEPKVTIEGLTEGKDYSVSYKNNVNVGTATVTIKGITDFCSGTITKTFSIEKPSIEGLDIKLSQEVYNYDGEEKRPKVSIEGLVENLDYRVSYVNNIDPGTAKVIITGIGGYGGTVEKTFKIEGEISPDVIDISTLDSKISMVKEVEYTGKVIEPKVSIEGLTEGADYIV